MTEEFLRWYELNERQMDGGPKQAAWLAWQHLQSARSVAQWRLDATGEQVSDLMPGTSFKDLSRSLQKTDAQRVDKAAQEFVALIIEAEGGEPGLHALAQHGARRIYPDGKQEFYWREKLLLTLNPTNPPRTTLDILQTQADWREGQADEIAKEITRQMG